MQNRAIYRVVVLGALAIIAIIVVQSYWVSRSFDLKEREFNQKVVISLRKVAEDLASLTGTKLPTTNLIKQVSSDSYVVNINDQIDANNLEYFLQKEMEAVSIDEDFEYGIYDCSSDQMLYGNYFSQKADKTLPKGPKTSLPRYDEFIYYFNVRFPNKSSFFLNNLWIPITFSLLLLISVIFFVYSISVILKQKRMSEMQKDFINNMTHEFKTPISTIKISADVFLKDQKIKTDSRLNRYAEIIKAQNQRLNDQVEKVLQLAKIEKDNFKLNFEATLVDEVLEGVIHSMQVQVEKDNGAIQANLNASGISVSADRLHLTNILHNIIDNSLKYCEQQPFIKVSTKRQQSQLIVSIEDNGIGIAKEEQAKVFNKFYRVPTGNLHDVKGFGLGLFYVRNICNVHGWKLSLNSDIDQGTIIKISMPIRN